ncbi:MAG: hypothetical protein IJ087_15020 [Eggerthellaceae bacterium]|nr:hypothetical protein [Eggerthellaceae bacterium]
MEQPITLHSRPSIENEAFRRYAENLVEIERDFHQAIGSLGLAVSNEGDDFEERVRRLRDLGVSIGNDCKSFHVGWISPACMACRKGVGTETFLTSTQCPRSCFFCFNPNQDD